MFDFNASIDDVEVRGFEKRTSKRGDDYLIVRVEDVTGKNSEFIDKNIDNSKVYRKGFQCNMLVNMCWNEKYNPAVHILEVSPRNNNKTSINAPKPQDIKPQPPAPWESF